MTTLGFISRLLLTLLLSIVLLALLSVAAFYVGWWLFGLTGHPAGPDVPPAAYLAYAIVAPLVCLGLSAWLIFWKIAKHNEP